MALWCCVAVKIIQSLAFLLKEIESNGLESSYSEAQLLYCVQTARVLPVYHPLPRLIKEQNTHSIFMTTLEKKAEQSAMLGD